MEEQTIGVVNPVSLNDGRSPGRAAQTVHELTSRTKPLSLQLFRGVALYRPVQRELSLSERRLLQKLMQTVCGSAQCLRQGPGAGGSWLHARTGRRNGWLPDWEMEKMSLRAAGVERVAAAGGRLSLSVSGSVK